MIDSVVRKWAHARERHRLRRRVVKTLALTPRGAVFNDGLPLQKLSNHLEVEWIARDVHPWDGDLPPERRKELFAIEATGDTLAAIVRMFDHLPEVDTIRLRVLGPAAPHLPVLAGTAHRSDLDAVARCPSPAMSLKLLGVHFVSS